MGGRKGYSLNKIVGNLGKVKDEKKDLLEGIKKKNPTQIARASVGILAKSASALESLAYSYLFVDSLKSSQKQLSKEDTKTRRKEIAKKWATFRKEVKKDFDPSVNRNIVDTATRILGGNK